MFIRISDKRIINMAHIISSKFSPGGSGTGEDGTQETWDATLYLTTTELEPMSNYDGDERGYPAINSKEFVRGKYAEEAWAVLQTQVVTTDPIKDR